MKRKWLFLILLVGAVLLTSAEGVTQTRTDVQGRWFAIDNIKGGKAVTAVIQGTTGPAEQGERLNKGDSIRTRSKGGRADLVTNDRRTIIKLGENTDLRVEQASKKDSTWFMRVYLSQGQIYISESKGSGDSKFTVETRTLTAAPRGTEFGITVDLSGKTGVATRQGSVVTEAEGQEKVVKAGFQNLTLPGEAPSEPIRLKNDKSLKDLSLSVVTDDEKLQKLRVKGKVGDPINLLSIGDELQEVSNNGQFDVTVPLVSPEQKVESIVTTPLGDRASRKLWSQTCTSLYDVGDKEVRVQKRVSELGLGLNRTNWNTDFAISPDQPFRRFWVKVVSEGISSSDIAVYLKYKDSSPQKFLAQRDLDSPEVKYVVAIPASKEKPFQVNVRIGDFILFGKSYIVSASGCSDNFDQ